MIRLISTDFDGTIYGMDSHPEITSEFLEKIGRLQKSGVKWVINTGREIEDLSSRLREVCPIFPDFIITVERQIHMRQDEKYDEHAEWNACCHAEHQTLFSQAGELLHQIREWISGKFDAHFYEDLWSPLCIIASTDTEADVIHRHAEKRCGEIPCLSVVRNGGYFRFSHQRYNKGTAMEEVGRLLGLRREEIFAAGDHYNDLPMLDGTYAQWVGAPSNAIPEVKEVVGKAGGFVANRSCSLGVVDALSHFQKS